jgi:hypothetical protein
MRHEGRDSVIIPAPVWACFEFEFTIIGAYFRMVRDDEEMPLLCSVRQATLLSKDLRFFSDSLWTHLD